MQNEILNKFLEGKSEHAKELVFHFISEYERVGKPLHVTALKSMIAISGKKRAAYIIYLGRDFIDIVFPFKKSYSENLCFTKIKKVPESTDFNHHFRMLFKEDINQEVKDFMKLALDIANE